jgi:hypothetical protein
LNWPDGFISLPVSPTKLFFAANSVESISKVMQANRQMVVNDVNLFVVSRARKFVFADDDSQASGIKSHIHTAMEPTPLFPQQAII